MGKYDKYFYKFVPQHTNWGSWCVSPQAYFRGNADLPGSNYNVGFQVFREPVYLEREPHFHREEEYLVFLGISRPNVFDFDAEIEVWIGEDIDNMERHIITKPTIVRIPKGMWHCPVDFKKVNKPVFFQAALMHGDFGNLKRRYRENGEAYYEYYGDGSPRGCVLDSSKQCNFCGSCYSHDVDPEKDWRTHNKASDGHKYDELFHEFKPEYTNWECCPSPQAYFRGCESMPGANYHVGFQMYTAPVPVEDPHFHQGCDEYLVIMGADFMDPFDWDADIEMLIGEDPDNMELVKIDGPTIVRIPPAMWHCPVYFHRIGKPIMFQSVFLAGVWGTISRRMNEDGSVDYVYRGDNTRFCVERPGVKCDYCGKCFTKKK